MQVLQFLRCATGHHVSSHRRSQVVDGKKESVCRHCGHKMVREDLAGRLFGADGASAPTNLTKL
ncbi:MAG: hypothetical protein ABIS51_12035 [Sphingomonas sp.]